MHPVRFLLSAVVATAFGAVWTSTHASAQTPTIRVEGDAVHVRAPLFHFMRGPILDQLKDGRSVRLEFELAVMPAPGAAPTATSRETFILSYDLWEERFAVTHTGVVARSISHLTAADAEAWCLDRLAVPRAGLAVGADGRFWARLEYVVRNDEPTKRAPGDDGLTLRGLIDRLSRRQTAGEIRDRLEAGPFRLP